MDTEQQPTADQPPAYVCTACGHEQRSYLKQCEQCAGRRLIAQSFALMMYGNGYRELFKDKSTNVN